MPAIKEIHFFDLQYERGIDWYYSFFPKKHLLKAKLTGEASPYYLFHPLVPERVFRYLPKIKIIVLLRNPVDRAYSHFMHQQKNIKNEPISDFEEAISLENTRIELQEAKLISGVLSHSENLQSFSYISRGLYYKQINNWFKYFPRAQFHFIRSEDFFQNIETELIQIYNFLEISIKPANDLLPQNTSYYPLLSQPLRSKLHLYFADDSKKLKSLIGEKFCWE
jgi:hypothetical protein